MFADGDAGAEPGWPGIDGASMPSMVRALGFWAAAIGGGAGCAIGIGGAIMPSGEIVGSSARLGGGVIGRAGGVGGADSARLLTVCGRRALGASTTAGAAAGALGGTAPTSLISPKISVGPSSANSSSLPRVAGEPGAGPEGTAAAAEAATASSMMSSKLGPPRMVGSSALPASPRCSTTSSLASAWGTPPIRPSRPSFLNDSCCWRSRSISGAKPSFNQLDSVFAVNTASCDIRNRCRSPTISPAHW